MYIAADNATDREYTMNNNQWFPRSKTLLLIHNTRSQLRMRQLRSMLNINMATIRSLPDEIHRFIVEEHQEVSEELKRACQKGLSCASVKRICAEENIHKVVY